VAAGEYRPDRGTGDRTAAFELRNRIAVYGGFSGSETSLDQRDWVANVTTLTGDLNGDDGPDFANYGENSHNVVRIDLSAEVGTDRLDGFLITGGNADGGPSPFSTGGGLYHAVGDNLHFLTIANCRFVRNKAVGSGGASFLDGSVEIIDTTFEENVGTNGGGVRAGSTLLSLTRCDFLANQADGHGGALYAPHWLTMDSCRFVCNSAASSGGAVASRYGDLVAARDCSFESNQAGGQGGGLYVDDPVAELVRCRFQSNQAQGSGGGAWIESWTTSRLDCCEFRGNVSVEGGGGGMDFRGLDGDAFVNCLFVGNSAAGSGGGVLLSIFGGGWGRTFVNCTFAGNTAGAAGGLFATDDEDTVIGSILWANTDDAGSGESSQITLFNGDIRYSCVQGWTGDLGGPGNHGLDPTFVDMDGADDVIGTADDDLRLQYGSWCIDAGDDAAVPADELDVDGDGDVAEQVPVDLAGSPRFFDTPNWPPTFLPGGGNPIVDMGAYEFGCPWDLDDSGAVGVTDFLGLLAVWGTDPGGPPDFDDDHDVGITDLLILLANWGPCP
jgi:predicted outer membrane repeat protein